MELALYDEDLQQYDYRALVKAYNDSVGTVPSSYDKPFILKNLMLKNLQSSGQKDPFEILQEQKIEGELGKADKLKGDRIEAAKKLALDRKRLEVEQGAVAREGAPGFFSRRAEQLGRGVAAAGKGTSGILEGASSKTEKLQKQIDQMMKDADPSAVQAAGGHVETRAALEEWLTNPSASGDIRRRLEDAGIKQKVGPGGTYKYGPPLVNPQGYK